MKRDLDRDKILTKIYQESFDRMQKEIDGFYMRYASKEGLTKQEAMKKASEMDVTKFADKAAKAVTTAKIDGAAVTASKLSYEVVEVTVTTGGTTGTGTVTAGSIILGYYPISNQDQFVDSIAVSETTLTITLATAATADNKFKVVLLKA